MVGDLLGDFEGEREGFREGLLEGDLDGERVGERVGGVGLLVGERVIVPWHRHGTTAALPQLYVKMVGLPEDEYPTAFPAEADVHPEQSPEGEGVLVA